MKKLFLLFALFISSILPLRAEDITSSEKYIVAEKVESIFYDSRTNKIITNFNSIAPFSNDIFEIRAKNTIYQMPVGKVDLGVTVSAVNHKAQISSISGTFSGKDTTTYGRFTQNISAYERFASSTISGYYSSIKAFAIGHHVNIKANYYISLLNGVVLNGGKINYSTTIKIVR